MMETRAANKEKNSIWKKRIYSQPRTEKNPEHCRVIVLEEKDSARNCQRKLTHIFTLGSFVHLQILQPLPNRKDNDPELQKKG
jgi:hypothetical protein